MKRLKGELSLQIIRYENGIPTLMKDHHQCNYDTIRGRLDPNFSDTCERVTRLECDRSYTYVKPVIYGELTTLPIYLNEPMFVPNRIEPDLTGDGFFALSYDEGSTWWAHDGIQFIQITVSTAAELRSNGMTASELSGLSADQHSSKYGDHVVLMATPNSDGQGIFGYKVNMTYDSDLIDPYYVRWIGDISTISRYTLDTLPISSSKTDNVYQINISNLAGVAPIDVDTILTYVGEYIGTFTKVGLSVDINEVMVGTYTITVEEDYQVDEKRSVNATKIFWSDSTPNYTDGILGGVRHHGAETRSQIYTYNGGPSPNAWMWPFTPDTAFRRSAMSRSILLPDGAAYRYGDNVIDPGYGLSTTGGIKLWSTDVEHRSGLSSLPLLYRYSLLTTGEADSSEYLLSYKTRVQTLLGESNIWNDTWINTDAWMGAAYGLNGYHLGHNHLLKDPDNPVIWNSLLYDQLDYNGETVPLCAINPFHDILLEVFESRMTIRKYGGETLVEVNANSNEVFATVAAALSDASGYDVVLKYYDSDKGRYYLASLPIQFHINTLTHNVDVAVTGDLSSRTFIGNVSDVAAGATAGHSLRDLLLVQNAQSGPWTSSVLLDQLKVHDGSFSTLLHEDLIGTDDGTVLFDQEWDYRHLQKLGAVSVAADTYGDQTAVFDGTSMAYLIDDNGPTGNSMRWNTQKQVSTYIEFQPNSLQTSTILSSRGGKYNIEADGTFRVLPAIPMGSNVYREGPLAISTTQVSVEDAKYDGYVQIPFIHPDSGDRTCACLNYNNLGVFVANLVGPTVSDYYPYDDGVTSTAKWAGVFYHGPSSSTRIARIHYDNTGLFVSTFDVDALTVSNTVEYLVGGVAFTHAENAYAHIYTNDDGDPILVIYSSSTWVDADGLLEINLRTEVLTQIPMTGTRYPWVDYYAHNDGNDIGSTYKNDLGQFVTVALRDPQYGQIYYYNHSLGTIANMDLGALLSLTRLAELWDLSSYYSRKPWAVGLVRGTPFLIFAASSYIPSWRYDSTDIAIIDLDRQLLIQSGAESLGNYAKSPFYPINTGDYFTEINTSRLLTFSCSFAQLPHGLPNSNDITRDIEIVRFLTPYATNTTEMVYVDVSVKMDVSSLLESTNLTATYNTAVNRFGILEFPGFQICLLDDEVLLAGPNKDVYLYDLDDQSPRLSNMCIGGSLEYVSGDTSVPSSYTSSNLYEGRVKNVVNHTQSPKAGVYKFPCYLYPVDSIISLITIFTGLTTFIIHMVQASAKDSKTFFLDANNGYLLTEITDINLAQVTPNTADTINTNMSIIKAAAGNSGQLGFVYYNIDGDPADIKVSKSYVEIECVATQPTSDYDRPRRNADMRGIYQNGRYFEIPEMSENIHNHLGDPIHTVSNEGAYRVGHFDMAILPGCQFGLYAYSKTGYSATSGGCGFIGLDRDDQLVMHHMGYNDFNTLGAPRRYIMSDLFRDNIDLGLWHRQHIDLTDDETEIFRRKDDSTSQFFFLPANMYSFDNGLINSQTRISAHIDSDRRLSTATPYPLDAPTEFTHVANASGYTEWGNLRWYFIGVGITPFIENEMISYGLGNSIGYSIDNWQLINTFSSLVKGEMDVSTIFGIQHSSSADGTMVGIPDRAGKVNISSTMVPEPTTADKFFITSKG